MKYVSLIPLGYFTGQADDPEKSKLYQQLNTIKDNLPTKHGILTDPESFLPDQ